MNINSEVKSILTKVLKQLNYDSLIAHESVTVENTKNDSHGDLATNVAMVIASKVNSKPEVIAQQFVDNLPKNNIFADVKVVKPGFINFTILHSYWHKLVLDVIHNGDNYGSSDLGQGIKINLEYVSANPTGPLHIGNARGAIIGDIMYRVMNKLQYEVTREYYINDAGKQIELLAKSLYFRYQQLLSNEEISIPQEYYPGDYLIEIAKDIVSAVDEQYLHNDNEKDVLKYFSELAIDKVMKIIQKQLHKLSVEYDVFVSEKKVASEEKIKHIVNLLQEKNLVYYGILDKPKGKNIDNWEATEQLLFRSTNFGDSEDRVLQNVAGRWTYFASDIAYHYDKYQRGFNNMIVNLGIDHIGYKTRLQSAVAAISDGKANIKIQFNEMVNLLENGKPLRMSKRQGKFLTVDDVLEKITPDVLRFIMVSKKSESVIDFDLKDLEEKSRDNHIFYIQYAHARICSVFRNSKFSESDILNLENKDLSHLKQDGEIKLIKMISHWPKVIELTCKHVEPHRIVFYLYDLASCFHNLWSLGNASAKMRFIIEYDDELSLARLALLKAAAVVIKSGLDLLCIDAVEEMK